MRHYESIFDKLKHADIDQWVEVRVASADRIQTIINMVQKEKSLANVSRKALDLPSFGRLMIRREPENKKVFFKLNNSGAAL
jgi:hypothetical protein